MLFAIPRALHAQEDEPAAPASEERGDVGDAPVDVTVHSGAAERATRLRESAQAVKVIETEQARQHTADLANVLVRTEGVAIQRGGGLGSSARISLHGLTDDQVRVFLDGVPLELAGFGIGIAGVPLGWVERVDVYRGVLSPRFGADALGGAIDLVTEGSTSGTSVRGSYTAGSFDTHQLTLQARTKHEPTHLFARTALFYDTTRNDYPIRVQQGDATGRLETVRARRFHDAYRALGGMLEGGIVDRPWAKRLTLRATATRFDKELQHDARMRIPYGGIEYGQTAVSTTAHYETRRRPKRPHLEVMTTYGHRRLDFDDRSRWVYDWFGRRVSEKQGGQAGELSNFPSDRSQWEDRSATRAVVTYPLATGHRVRLALSPDYVVRDGRERLRVNRERLDPLTTRRTVFQLVSGLEYELRDGSDIVENLAFVKHYVYRPSSDQVVVIQNAVVPYERHSQRFGAGDALRVRVSDALILKASYEYATRIPRPDEVFGDGVLMSPNLELAPERSHNGNLSARLEQPLGRADRLGVLTAEAAGFARDAKDLIALLVAQDRIHTYHRNVGSARTLGVDGMVRWVSPGRWLTLEGNATYQDQRNTATGGDFAKFEGQRIPNRPWLFANGAAALRIPKLAAEHDALTLSWTLRYVRTFQPDWANTEATESNAGKIPNQLTHALGAVYAIDQPFGIELTIDVFNVTNARVFDSLGVQLPGRSAFFKAAIHWDRSHERPPTEEGS